MQHKHSGITLGIFMHTPPPRGRMNESVALLYLTTHPATSCSNGSCHAHAVFDAMFDR